MIIVHTRYRPRRAPRTRQPPLALARVVTVTKPKPARFQPQPVAVIVRLRRPSRRLFPHLLIDHLTAEEIQARGDAADRLLREVLRRAAGQVPETGEGPPRY